MNDPGREADELDTTIADLKTKADAAAKRPGKMGTVQPGDLLAIEVLEALPGRPITGERVVKPDGTVTLGFYGDLQVNGLTCREIKLKVIAHLQKFLTDDAVGLVGLDPNGKETKIAPEESDRVFVDDSDNYWPSREKSPAGTLQLDKLDAIQRDLDAIKARLNHPLAQPAATEEK